MLAECVNCGFYVGSNEKICPDCGLSAPNAPVKFNPGDFNRSLIFKLTAIIAIVIYAAIILFRVRERNNDFSDLFGLLAIIALISLAVSVFAASFIAYRSTKNEKQQRFASMKSATNFRFIENTILLRNHELKEKLREFRSSPKRGVRLSDDAKKSKTPPQKIEILNLIARYDLLSSKIDYARFENQLLPIIEKRNTPENGEDFSETLDEIRSK
jgi:hypothetical protein